MGLWYARPVLYVADIAASVAFYTGKLGFVEAWRHVSDGAPIVAQVERAGCELILSSQWPDKAGKAMMFISLDRADFAALRPALEGKGVRVGKGHWGYPVLIITDPDGNRLYFPDPVSEDAS